MFSGSRPKPTNKRVKKKRSSNHRQAPLVKNRRKNPSTSTFSKKGTTQRRKAKVVRPTSGYVRATTPNLPTGRLIFCMVCISLLFMGVLSRLIWMSQVPPIEPRATLRTMPERPTHRGDIYDANGILLATTLQAYSLYADPARMLASDDDLERLAAIVPQIKTPKIQRRISNKKRRFVWVARRLSPSVAHKINALGIPGLGFRTEHVRVYPHQNLFSHIVGATNVDGQGLAGVERSQNEKLARGEDVTLTVRLDIQQQLRDSILAAQEKSESKAGWGVVTNPQTGAILAMVSLPDFDPHDYGNAKPNTTFNRPTLGVYEMGSTFKLFTLAHGLDAETITPETEIDATEPLKIGRFTINDFHAKKRVLSAMEVLRYSSNIGAAKIADELGPESQRSFMDKLGFLKPLNVGINEIGKPIIPRNWRRIQTLTISFGHGIAVTPMHLMAAVGALVTDGHYRDLSVLTDHIQDAPTQIITPETVTQIRSLMEDVVANGSGRNSKVNGLYSGGKTGTAEKVGSSGYSETENLVSFISAAPLDNPEILSLIMLDEPIKKYATGGRIAAPAMKDFQTRVLPLLNLPLHTQPVPQEIAGR